MNMTTMKVTKTHPDAIVPSYAKHGDAGFDLRCLQDTLIHAGETKIIPTGIAFEIPEGHEIQVRPRSGVTYRTKLRVQLGTIDSNFRGSVGIILDNDSDEAILIEKGERIAQGVLAPVVTALFQEVDTLSETNRGMEGFGSSGRF